MRMRVSYIIKLFLQLLFQGTVLNSFAPTNCACNCTPAFGFPAFDHCMYFVVLVSFGSTYFNEWLYLRYFFPFLISACENCAYFFRSVDVSFTLALEAVFLTRRVGKWRSILSVPLDTTLPCSCCFPLGWSCSNSGLLPKELHHPQQFISAPPS